MSLHGSNSIQFFIIKNSSLSNETNWNYWFTKNFRSFLAIQSMISWYAGGGSSRSSYLGGISFLWAKYSSYDGKGCSTSSTKLGVRAVGGWCESRLGLGWLSRVGLFM